MLYDTNENVCIKYLQIFQNNENVLSLIRPEKCKKYMKINSMLSILFIVFNPKLNYKFCYYFFIFARNELFCLVHTHFSGIDYFVSEVLVFLHSKAVRTWYLHLKHKLRPCCPTLWWRKEVGCGGRRWGRSESRRPSATTHLISWRSRFCR